MMICWPIFLDMVLVMAILISDSRSIGNTSNRQVSQCPQNRDWYPMQLQWMLLNLFIMRFSEASSGRVKPLGFSEFVQGVDMHIYMSTFWSHWRHQGLFSRILNASVEACFFHAYFLVVNPQVCGAQRCTGRFELREFDVIWIRMQPASKSICLQHCL